MLGRGRTQWKVLYLNAESALTLWPWTHANMQPHGGCALVLSASIFVCITANTAAPRACALFDRGAATTANHSSHMILNPASQHPKPLKGKGGAGSQVLS